MITYEEIFENNKKWIENEMAVDHHFFEKLSEVHDPNFLYIGCSDSRVSAEEIMGAEPGEIFVHRNIANLVPNNDYSANAVINYAIGHLNVKHVVVCGHYLCGGIKAAMQRKDYGSLNPWLRNIKDVYRLHVRELAVIEDETERYDRLVELNVKEQCINVIKTSVFQLHYKSHGFPDVHGWVFDVKSGRLIDLNIDFLKIVESIREIYDLGMTE
jgi:carbonic anhydrase